MMLQSEVEVSSTREKLRLLEESYEELARETGGDEELRDASMESLKRLINQFKEEIARYEAGCRRDSERNTQGIKSDLELLNTRNKLQRLKELYKQSENDTEDLELREIELESIQRTINQFKEEIARYEARHVVR